MLRVKQGKLEAGLRAADARVEELELELAHAKYALPPRLSQALDT